MPIDSHPHAKQALKQELLEVLTQELGNLERAYEATMAGATHEQAKPENNKDTRALEQTYLARGQGQRVAEMRTAVAGVQRMAIRAFAEDGPIGAGSLVRLTQDDEERLLFMAPGGGGVSLAAGTVQVVTPRSPIGRTLLGKRLGDECELVVAGRRRTIQVVDIT